MHVFTEATDKEFHCHPFDFTAHVIAGSYNEEILLANSEDIRRVETFHRRVGIIHPFIVRVLHSQLG